MLVYVSDTCAESVWTGLRETTKGPRQESQLEDPNFTSQDSA